MGSSTRGQKTEVGGQKAVSHPLPTVVRGTEVTEGSRQKAEGGRQWENL